MYAVKASYSRITWNITVVFLLSISDYTYPLNMFLRHRLSPCCKSNGNVGLRGDCRGRKCWPKNENLEWKCRGEYASAIFSLGSRTHTLPIYKHLHLFDWSRAAFWNSNKIFCPLLRHRIWMRSPSAEIRRWRIWRWEIGGVEWGAEEGCSS